MRFYDREVELKILKDMRLQSSHKSRMTFIVGRRRVGKTRLIKEAFSSDNLVYFFVAKKNENLLCEEYCSINEESLGAKIVGQLSSDSLSGMNMFS
ncbi:MAG: ATP-binding protein [Desulfonatronovibrio sp. MSAO_Bac4]|nr:MAG: ATP-binding protein [Desulfonatronovibrio sp. MSAO_Bac4]